MEQERKQGVVLSMRQNSFKSKAVKRDQEDHTMIKGSTQQEETTAKL